MTPCDLQASPAGPPPWAVAGRPPLWPWRRRPGHLLVPCRRPRGDRAGRVRQEDDWGRVLRERRSTRRGVSRRMAAPEGKFRWPKK